MATDAGVRLMRRQLEFCLVHEQRSRFAGGIRFGERIVAVTIETIAVFQSGGCRPGQREQTEHHRHHNEVWENEPSVISHANNLGYQN